MIEMKYYSIEYPNHVKLIIKSDLELVPMLKQFTDALGISYHGTIYNTKYFISTSKLYLPDSHDKKLVQDLQSNLVWRF